MVIRAATFKAGVRYNVSSGVFLEAEAGSAIELMSNCCLQMWLVPGTDGQVTKQLLVCNGNLRVLSERP